MGRRVAADLRKTSFGVVLALVLVAGAACTGDVGESALERVSTTPAPPAGPRIAVDFDDRAGPSAGGISTGDRTALDESVVVVALVDEIVARVGPGIEHGEVASIVNPRPTGAPAVFLAVGAIDGDWVEVLLPVRPNGTTGWVAVADVELRRNPYRIEIDTGEHRLVVRDGDEVLIETTVAIGTGNTPTPIGSFYLTELLRPPDPTGPYGTHAFGLSGFSETLTSFNGGDGVVGIHGTDDPGSLGLDVSHGCIRVANDRIDEMASFLPLGTPVDITP